MASVKLSKREQNKVDCQTTILKVSRRLFTRLGYRETRMEDIARKAHISKATLYNYFPNKESMLIGTANEIMKELQLCDAKLVREHTSAHDRFVSAYRILVYGSLQYPDLVRLIVFYHSLEGHELYHSLTPALDLFRTIFGAIYDESAETDEKSCEERVNDPLLRKRSESIDNGDGNGTEEDVPRNHFIESGLEFFLGMYYTILFHSDCSYPADTERIDERMRITVNYLLDWLRTIG